MRRTATQASGGGDSHKATLRSLIARMQDGLIRCVRCNPCAGDGQPRKPHELLTLMAFPT
jgi:hypothetical protein